MGEGASEECSGDDVNDNDNIVIGTISVTIFARQGEVGRGKGKGGGEGKGDGQGEAEAEGEGEDKGEGMDVGKGEGEQGGKQCGCG